MTKQVKCILTLLILAVCACCAFVLLRPKAAGTTAVIKQDGTVLREIDLSALTGPVTFEVAGADGRWNSVIAEPGRIRVDSASCPDQVCVHQGWISDSSIPIVCLPNRLVIEVSGEGAQVDAAVK